MLPRKVLYVPVWFYKVFKFPLKPCNRKNFQSNAYEKLYHGYCWRVNFCPLVFGIKKNVLSFCRKLEQEHKEKLALVRSELTKEMDLMHQAAGAQREELEAEIHKIREDETFLRDHLSISVKVILIYNVYVFALIVENLLCCRFLI